MSRDMNSVKNLRAKIIEIKNKLKYLEDIFLNLPVGVTILKLPDFRYLMINKWLADLNGLPIKDHIGKPVAKVLPESSKHIIQNLRRVMKSGKAILGREFQIRLPKHPNDVRYLMDFHYPIKVDGNIVAIGAVVLDITLRKKIEEKLKRLTDIINQTSDFVGYADAKTMNIYYINPGGRKMIGIELNEDISKYNISDAHPEWTNKFSKNNNFNIFINLFNTLAHFISPHIRHLGI